MAADLSLEERNSLEQFQSITGLQEEESIKILSSKSWNLERAINSALDSEQQQQEEAPLLPQASSVAQDNSHHRIPTVAPPRPSLVRLVTVPFLWTFKFIWTLFSFTLSYLPFLSRPRLQQQDPLDACKEFHELFLKSYGSSGPKFFMGSYSQALDAAKRDLKFLVVYLHSHNHDDTDQFCIDTLCTEIFTSFLRDNDFLFWAGDIRKSEAFKVGSMVGAVKYPFMAMIALHENRMKIVHRFLGLTSAQDCVQTLQRLKSQLEPTYIAARAERAEREAGRSIREQQDLAYQLSLQQDREKAEKLRQAEEERKREEELAEKAKIEAERKRQEKLERKQYLKDNLVPEPDVDAVEFVTKMNIRLTSGVRLIRTFDATAPIQQLYDFVETHDLEPIDLLSDFVIVNTYPRKEYHEKSLSFKDAGLFPNATVLVEELDPLDA